MSRNIKLSNIAFQKHDHRRCQRQLLSAARRLCETRQLRLTSRRRQVLEILLASHQPLGAYDILAELNRPASAERIAPPIVYRALEFLLAQGLVHRLESRNAFIGCVHPGHHCAAQFLICRGCEQVAELENPDAGLLAQADDLGFAVDHSVVEITGVCAQCQKYNGNQHVD
jgi:Fur family zinc uptake transcriptional regulator